MKFLNKVSGIPKPEEEGTLMAGTMGTIILEGIIGGTGWYNQECARSFRKVYSNAKLHNVWQKDYTGLRNAVLDVTNDGDFQTCNIACAVLSFTMFNRLENGNVKETKYSIELNAGMKQISDCFVSEEDSFKFQDMIYGDY